MEDKRVTSEQILVEIGIAVEHMAQNVADAINNAQAGATMIKAKRKCEMPMQSLGKRPAKIITEKNKIVIFSTLNLKSPLERVHQPGVFHLISQATCQEIKQNEF